MQQPARNKPYGFCGRRAPWKKTCSTLCSWTLTSYNVQNLLLGNKDAEMYPPPPTHTHTHFTPSPYLHPQPAFQLKTQAVSYKPGESSSEYSFDMLCLSQWFQSFLLMFGLLPVRLTGSLNLCNYSFSVLRLPCSFNFSLSSNPGPLSVK